MALRGVRVVEMSGLAPGPFCGMILSDFGAKVVRVDKTKSFNHMDTLARGKKSIAVDLKKKEGVALIRKLCASSDVLIEPYRPGVMEKLGLGPELLMRDNPRLIYARLTGFGQSGYLAKRAGHDINYLAVSGVLSMLGRHGEKPLAPINFLADFAGGGLMCAFGIVTSLLERVSSGKGQVVDANMVEGSGYLGSFMWRSREMPGIWGNERGQNALDGGAHFYDTYKTADGKYMAVGAIEPQFYDALLTGVGFTHEELPQLGDWAALKEKLAERFASKTQAEWCKIFDHVDACVTPVVDWEKVNEYAHNMDKGSFTKTGEGYPDPIPAPRLSRTPGDKGDNVQPETGQDTFDILTEIGFSDEDILRLGQSGIIEQKYKSKI